MTSIELLLNQPWAARLGWTLVHFLWQGTLIAILFAAVRGLAGRWLGPGARYALACLALAALVTAPLLTFLAITAPGSAYFAAPVWRVSGSDWERALPWLVPVWIAGVVAFSVRLMAGWRWTRRLRSVAVSPVDGEWQRALNQLTLRMRVSAPVRMLVSSLATTPAVVGWLRPLILMPAEALATLPIEQVRALLAHELAHIRRHDYLVNILQSIVETVLFYHPAVWWVSQQIRAEREVCCDDLAVAATGDLLVYATALADLDSRRRASVAAALAANGGSLVHRIRRLVGESQPDSHNLPGPGVAWALSLLWLAGIGAAMLHGAPTLSTTGPRVALRPFIAPSVAAAPRVLLGTPPRPSSPSRSPVLSALLFDPFFNPPQAPPAPTVGAQRAKAEPQNQANLEGRVVNALDGSPLAGARIKLNRIHEAVITRSSGPIAAARLAPNDSGEPLFTKTDAQGHFQFPATTLGTYTLNAEQPGFLRTYDPRNPRDPIMLLDFIPPASGSTGAYRLGTFEIAGVGSVTKSLDANGSLHAVAVIPLTPSAVITGRITEPSGVARNNALVEILARRGDALATVLTTQTDDRGEYRAAHLAPGTYYVMAARSGTWTTSARSFRSTYYPAALDAASSTPLALAAGQQARADIRIRSTAGVSVTGAVTPAVTTAVTPMDAAGTSTKVMLYQPDVLGKLMSGFAEASGGRFELKNVMSGKYTLLALTRATTTDGTEGTPLAGALRQIEVGDRNLEGMDVALQPLRDLPGTVVFAQGCVPVEVHVAAAGRNAFGVSRAEAVPDSAGEFTLKGLIPAKHNLTIELPFGYAASAQLDGGDALKDGFYYPAAEGGALRINVGCTGIRRNQ